MDNLQPAPSRIQLMEDMFMGVRAQVRSKVTLVMPVVAKVTLGGSLCVYCIVGNFGEHYIWQTKNTW